MQRDGSRGLATRMTSVCSTINQHKFLEESKQVPCSDHQCQTMPWQAHQNIWIIEI